jgi:hypothetical protein
LTSEGPSGGETRAAQLLEDYVASPDPFRFEPEFMPGAGRDVLGLLGLLQARVLATFNRGVAGRVARSAAADPLDHPSVQAILAAQRPLQFDVFIVAIQEVSCLGTLQGARGWNGNELRRRRRLTVLLPHLVRVLQRRQPFTPAELTTILEAIVACPADTIWGGWSAVVPLPPILRAVERHASANALSPDLESALRRLRATGETSVMCAEQRKLMRLIDDSLRSDGGCTAAIDPDDDW